MYGITPRAKMETLRKPPPENMSNTPNKVPWAWAKKSAMALASTPGMGT